MHTLQSQTQHEDVLLLKIQTHMKEHEKCDPGVIASTGDVTAYKTLYLTCQLHNRYGELAELMTDRQASSE